MSLDLSSLNFGLVGWLFIGAAVIVLGVGLFRLLGHLFHIAMRGCGVVLVALIAWYVLRLVGIL